MIRIGITQESNSEEVLCFSLSCIRLCAVIINSPRSLRRSLVSIPTFSSPQRALTNFLACGSCLTNQLLFSILPRRISLNPPSFSLHVFISWRPSLHSAASPVLISTEAMMLYSGLHFSLRAFSNVLALSSQLFEMPCR